MFPSALIAFSTAEYAQGAAQLAQEIAPSVEKKPFVPCGPQDRLSAGWVAPAKHAPDLLTYQVGEAIILELCVESRTVPSDTLKKELKARIKWIEAGQPDEDGNLKAEVRKVGRKEEKEVKEQLEKELLPRAFPKSRHLRIWWLPTRGWLWVETANASQAEFATQILRETLGSLPTALPATHLDPVTAMTTWVELQAPEGFNLEGQCTLASASGEKKATLVGHDLHSQDVRGLLQGGNLVRQLAMTWTDRVSFVLTDKGNIKGIEMLGLINDAIAEANWEDAQAKFDGSVHLVVGELCALLDALIQAMGGLAGKQGQGSTVDLVGQQEADDDELFPKALAFVQQTKRATISALQREFRIGYNRAAYLIERMERQGAVSPMDTGGTRTVILRGAPW